MISARSRPGPRCRVDRQPELVMDPARQRAAAPVGLEELAAPASGRSSRSTRLAFSWRNSSRSSRPNSNSSPSWLGELPEVLLLEVQLEPVVGPVRQGLPGPLRRVGVGGEVLLDGLADRLVELALGLGAGRSRAASSKRRALEVARRSSSTPSRWRDPLGEAGRAVVVGQEPARRRP